MLAVEFLCDRHNQQEVRIDEPVLGLAVTALDPFC
jgi:hypothetical protein